MEIITTAEGVNTGNIKLDAWETAQTLPMSKRTAFKAPSNKRGYNKPTKTKRNNTNYKLRRCAIKRGELGVMARFGKRLWSSWWN